MPFLNDEVKEWIGLELRSLGVEDLAVYVLEAGAEGDERRVLVATEIGLLDHRYAPFGSSARYRLAMLLYPWQVLRGVELRADTFRLWAMEHRTRWAFRLHHPHFEAATESPELGQALCDLARVCAVMAEPFGVPAGRAAATEPLAATAAIEVGGRARPRAQEGEDGAGSAADMAAATELPASEAGSQPEAEAELASDPAAAGDEAETDAEVEAHVADAAAEPPPADESVEEQIGMVEMGDGDEGERG
jgi:hypothetical protein